MFYADLHIHSKYSRATSPQMEVVTLDLWARKKGIGITVEFKKGRDNIATVLFKADRQAFKVDKQDIKPYIKKGLIEETVTGN